VSVVADIVDMVVFIKVAARQAMTVAAAVVFVKTIASMVTVAVMAALAEMVAVVAVINVAAEPIYGCCSCFVGSISKDILFSNM
jgi:hypothetical protein